jgi:alpha-mannosidase
MMDRNMFMVDGFACKPANDKKSLIIRLQETINKSTNARLKLTNHPITIKLDFKPHEIKTIKIEAGGKWSEVDLINE